jgi:hypothetical protein
VTRDHGGKRVNDVLDPLVGREETEGEKLKTIVNVKAFATFLPIREKRYPVGNHVDLFERHAMHLLQKLGTIFAHHDDTAAETQDLLHHAALVRGGLSQNGMKRGHDRHAQLPESAQNVRSGLSAKDAVFVLQAEDLKASHIEEVSSAAVGAYVALGDFEQDLIVVRVAFANIVHGNNAALDANFRAGQRTDQVRCKSGDPAVPR